MRLAIVVEANLAAAPKPKIKSFFYPNHIVVPKRPQPQAEDAYVAVTSNSAKYEISSHVEIIDFPQALAAVEEETLTGQGLVLDGKRSRSASLLSDGMEN